MSADPSQVSVCLVTIGEQERLWSYIDKRGPDECWPWLKGLNGRGYGMFVLRRRSRLAHRIVSFVVDGPIPDGICVLHRCDNPRCCNPAHLFRGTRTDNNRDMWAKGRNAPMPRPNLRGERHPLSRLTTEQVVALKARLARGESVTALAREHGVSHALVSGIAKGKKWAWVQTPAM